MQNNHEILKLKDQYGNIAEVMKRTVEEGDRVVIVVNPKDMTLLTHIPTQKYVVSTVTKIINQGISGGRRIVTDRSGGSWHEDNVYQIID